MGEYEKYIKVTIKTTRVRNKTESMSQIVFNERLRTADGGDDNYLPLLM